MGGQDLILGVEVEVVRLLLVTCSSQVTDCPFGRVGPMALDGGVYPNILVGALRSIFVAVPTFAVLGHLHFTRSLLVRGGSPNSILLDSKEGAKKLKLREATPTTVVSCAIPGGVCEHATSLGVHTEKMTRCC